MEVRAEIMQNVHHSVIKTMTTKNVLMGKKEKSIEILQFKFLSSSTQSNSTFPIQMDFLPFQFLCAIEKKNLKGYAIKSRKKAAKS